MGIARDEFDRLVAEYPEELEGWVLEISSRMTSYGGYCYWDEKIIRLAEWLTTKAPKKDIINTVRHEVAHALAPRGTHHGKVWKEWAVTLGAKPVPQYDDALLPLRAAAQRGR